jgi:hypothetical protein
MAVGVAGIGGVGTTNGALGAGAAVSPTRVPTTPGAKAGAIPNQIGAASLGLVVRNLAGARSQAGEKSPHNQVKAE